MTIGHDADASIRERKRQLRRELRRARRTLEPDARRAADRRICQRISNLACWHSARHVASFLAFDGEPSLAGLHGDRRWRHKRFYVPVITSHRIKFAPLNTRAAMQPNMFGISEPRHRRRIETSRLDIVLVSLVGFDTRGYRLGMGGGFYDRHFNALLHRTYWRKPRLIGVAYDLQKVPAVPRDVWDVPLWGVVTERNFYKA